MSGRPSQKNRRLGQLGKAGAVIALTKHAMRRQNQIVTSAKRGGSTYVAPAVQAVVDKAIVNEKKRNAHYVDLAAAIYEMSTTGAIVLVATIAGGAAQTQRIGKKCLYKSVQIRGSAHSKTATTATDGCAILVYDRDPTDQLPAITDILNTISSRAFNKDDNSDRFKIVRRWDWTFTGNSATPTTGKEAYNFDEYVDMRNLPVQFGGATTGAIGDIKLGALYFVTAGTTATGTAAAEVNCGFRTRFIDLD